LAFVAAGSNFTDSSGTNYQADANYSGGRTARGTAAIAGTVDDYLYQGERYGNFSYSIPASNGSYRVTLKFAENYWTATGRRVFNVNINGTRVITNLDIFAKAGRNAAYDVVVPVNVTTGLIKIDFITVVDNAKVGAIRIEPVLPVTFAAVAAGSAFTDSSGVSYRADANYSGGNTARVSSAIAGTVDDYLYQGERYGTFSYSVPTSNGNYRVTLKFAENYWSAAGQRVFNVNLNGTRVITNLDIFAKAGRNAAYDVVVPVNVTTGLIKIDFITVVDNAKVSAIRIEPTAIQASLVSQSGWTLKYADSQETAGENGTARNAFDGNPATFWMTQWSPWGSTAAPLPHEIQIDLGSAYILSSLRYLPRQDQWLNGNIKTAEFYVSMDGVNWGTPVAQPNFTYSFDASGKAKEMEVSFAAKAGQFVRIRALSEVNGNPWTSIAEVNLLGVR